MKYGKFLKQGSTIGVTSPSFGVGGYPYVDKYNNAIKNMNGLGYKVVSSSNVLNFNVENIVNNPSYEIKAKELIESYKDENIDLIWASGGGELMVKTINSLNIEDFKSFTPKWYLGFSDNTWLDFLLTTICDVATIYTYNFCSLGTSFYHDSHKKLLDLISGKDVVFESYDKYEIEDLTHQEGKFNVGFNLTENNYWKELNNKENIEFSGRIIGGCLDILINIIGTKYDKVNEFVDKYYKDGFIWYFESCDLNLLSQLRAYLQIQNSSWLRNVKGILIGRPIKKESMYGYDYETMLKDAFKNISCPIIYDCDIGHLPPQIPIVNGSVATVKYSNKKGTIQYKLI